MRAVETKAIEAKAGAIMRGRRRSGATTGSSVAMVRSRAGVMYWLFAGVLADGVGQGTCPAEGGLCSATVAAGVVRSVGVWRSRMQALQQGEAHAQSTGGRERSKWVRSGRYSPRGSRQRAWCRRATIAQKKKKRRGGSRRRGAARDSTADTGARKTIVGAGRVPVPSRPLRRAWRESRAGLVWGCPYKPLPRCNFRTSSAAIRASRLTCTSTAQDHHQLHLSSNGRSARGCLACIFF